MSRSLRVVVHDDVAKFVAMQGPESRRRLRLALRGLAHEKGDLRPLSGDWAGYHRLRVGSFRVIYKYCASASGPCLECVFIESRDVVYLLMEEEWRRRIQGR